MNINMNGTKEKPVYVTVSGRMFYAALVEDLYLMLSIASAAGVEFPRDYSLTKAKTRRAF